MSVFITSKDLERGFKRINLTLSISEFESIINAAEYNSQPVANMAKSWIVKQARIEEKKARKEGFPFSSERGESLFDKPKKRKVKKS